MRLTLLTFLLVTTQLIAAEGLREEVQNKYLPEDAIYDENLSLSYQEKLLHKTEDPTTGVRTEMFLFVTEKEFEETVAEFTTRGIEFKGNYNSQDMKAEVQEGISAKQLEVLMFKIKEAQSNETIVTPEWKVETIFYRAVGIASEGYFVVVERPYYNFDERIWIDKTIIRFVKKSEMPPLMDSQKVLTPQGSSTPLMKPTPSPQEKPTTRVVPRSAPKIVPEPKATPPPQIIKTPPKTKSKWKHK